VKIAIMQPYFLPYIGYFQLIAAVDIFIVYDNIKYTKKGWINRNRMLQNGKDIVFSLPLKNDSDYLDVRDRELARDFNRSKLLNQMVAAYRHAPYYSQTIPLIEAIVSHPPENLFRFIYHSIALVCLHLGLSTEMRISSDVPIDHSLKSQDKVLALCHRLGATTYINSIGGIDLYSREAFAAQGVELKFLKSKPFAYAQFGSAFVPWLSIVDVLMFNSVEATRNAIASNIELVCH
jgi:hypothetical protein